MVLCFPTEIEFVVRIGGRLACCGVGRYACGRFPLGVEVLASGGLTHPGVVFWF